MGTTSLFVVQLDLFPGASKLLFNLQFAGQHFYAFRSLLSRNDLLVRLDAALLVLEHSLDVHRLATADNDGVTPELRCLGHHLRVDELWDSVHPLRNDFLLVAILIFVFAVHKQGVCARGLLIEEVERGPQPLGLAKVHCLAHGQVRKVLGLHGLDLVGTVLVGALDAAQAVTATQPRLLVDVGVLHPKLELVGVPVLRHPLELFELVSLHAGVPGAFHIVLVLLQEAKFPTGFRLRSLQVCLLLERVFSHLKLYSFVCVYD